MSILADFKRAERELAMRVRAFQEMKQSPEVQKAMEFETALDDFLAKQKTTRAALYELLTIDMEPAKKPATKMTTAAKPAAATPKKKHRRQPNRNPPTLKVRTFKNPHTGEELVVRGNRDGKFNAWNAKYGINVVRGWQIAEEIVPPKAQPVA